MQKFNLTLLNPETIDELLKIANDHPEYTLEDALEVLAKSNNSGITEVGTLHEDGKFTQTEVTMEGVEIKEVSFEKTLRTLIDDCK
jgi:hypothetical protein